LTDLQNAQMVPEVLEYAILPLRGQEQWLNRNGWKCRKSTPAGCSWHRCVGDHEFCHVRQRRDSLRDVTAGWLLEIEEHRQVVPLAEFLTDGVENDSSFRGEATKDQDDLGCDRINDVADLLVVQEEVDKLSTSRLST
jgi:hypothetical protein